MKKVISLVLCAIMITSSLSVNVFASTKMYKSKTDDNLYINFDPSNSGWSDYEKIYCNISSYIKSWETIYPRFSEQAMCTDDDGDGIYTYSFNKSEFNFNDEDFYLIEFENDNNKSTFRLVMQVQNLTDTVYCNGSNIINWKNYKQRYIPALKDIVKQYEEENGVKLETYRCYFLIPDGSENFVDPYGDILPDWLNEYCDNIVIDFSYGKNNEATIPEPSNHVGYGIEKTYINNLYYADIPVNISLFSIANDAINQDTPTYSYCYSTTSLTSKHSEGYEMVYVIDSLTNKFAYDATANCSGDWYYYLGGKCYSDTKDGECVDKNHGKKSIKEAINEYEESTGKKVETNRYYFLMPNGKNGLVGEETKDYSKSWYNNNANRAGIYWWGSGIADPKSWPGYKIEKTNFDDIYYADVPSKVPTIVFNNYFDGGTDTQNPIFYDSHQTVSVACDYYEAGDSDTYPDGIKSFDNMIFVVNPDPPEISNLSIRQSVLGEWYYYYVGGCFGTVKDGNFTNCIRDDHFDENGKHTGPEYILGDSDRDNMLSVMDATDIQLTLVRMKKWNDRNAEVIADFDKDGTTSVMDATAIQYKLAKLS